MPVAGRMATCECIISTRAILTLCMRWRRNRSDDYVLFPFFFYCGSGITLGRGRFRTTFLGPGAQQGGGWEFLPSIFY